MTILSMYLSSLKATKILEDQGNYAKYHFVFV